MLTVVNQEPRVHGDLQHPEPAAVGLADEGLKFDLGIYRRRESREDIRLRVAQHVAGEFRQTSSVERALCPDFRRQIRIVKLKESRNQP
jgi:hypothetical protein